ncbi:helix-turn-helix transcriptional regulator [Halegenticoccus tardaugens]|uniref:helix-turn-helix transcriptional regulator n=1 Tax=Halegenticoccus tardaugens TaxID=2071624 RepID=UPI001E4EDE23|nr:transcriptional regulator [Halegenticoccus tardaugens]
MDRSHIFDELVRSSLELWQTEEPGDEPDERIETDELVAIVRHGPLLEALMGGPLDRRDVEERLGISRATSHRFTRWLEDRGFAERRDGPFALTGEGQIVAEELRRFERNVRAARRLAPLLDSICPDHQEFVVEPFADAVVTTATPDDPYRPVTRFLSLLRESRSFRGFNTTHMVPPLSGLDGRLFADRDVELIYLPDVVETLRATDEDFDAALEAGRLTLHTREALPYGLAVFDDRVGIGGYDEETGAMRVFVDTDAAIAREWAERVYAAYRADSEPLVA